MNLPKSWCLAIASAITLALTLAPAAQAQELSISKVDGKDPVPVGGSIIYHMQLRNTGRDTLNLVQIHDPLPAGLTFVSASSGGSYEEQENAVCWQLGSLAPGESLTATLTVRVEGTVSPGTVVTNVATARAEGLAGISASQTTRIVAGPPFAFDVAADPCSALIGSVVQISAAAYDAYGNLVADGTTVDFDTSLGQFVATGTAFHATATQNGIAATSVTSDAPGRALIAASVLDRCGFVTVDFYVAEPTSTTTSTPLPTRTSTPADVGTPTSTGTWAPTPTQSRTQTQVPPPTTGTPTPAHSVTPTPYVTLRPTRTVELPPTPTATRTQTAQPTSTPTPIELVIPLANSYRAPDRLDDGEGELLVPSGPLIVGHSKIVILAIRIGSSGKNKTVVCVSGTPEPIAAPPWHSRKQSIPIYEIMGAELDAPAFNIQAQAPPEQAIACPGETVWTWLITPCKPGPQSLTVRIYITLHSREDESCVRHTVFEWPWPELPAVDPSPSPTPAPPTPPWDPNRILEGILPVLGGGIGAWLAYRGAVYAADLALDRKIGELESKLEKEAAGKEALETELNRLKQRRRRSDR